MESTTYLRMLRDRWGWIVAFTVVGLAAGLAFSFVGSREYVATSRVFLSTASASSFDSLQGGLFAQSRLQSYAKIVNGQDVVNGTIDELGLTMSPNELAASISAEQLPNSVLMDINVADSDPARARDIANEVTRQMIRLVETLEVTAPDTPELAAMKVINQATTPTVPSGNPPRSSRWSAESWGCSSVSSSLSC
ncbi:MAG: Wzz/FepE/Etk N-terminal domain-containing protein [Rhodococcus sp. (in: high G+C Gram-positive bacteria)]|uniref:YveK family protein n=1 Tax=Rhodococcus sp. TaxID=1831 RepID=UPI003BB78958